MKRKTKEGIILFSCLLIMFLFGIIGVAFAVWISNSLNIKGLLYTVLQIACCVGGGVIGYFFIVRWIIKKFRILI